MVKIGALPLDTSTKRRASRPSTGLLPPRTKEMRVFVLPKASWNACRERKDPTAQQDTLETEALSLLALGRSHRMARSCNQTNRNVIGCRPFRCRR